MISNKIKKWDEFLNEKKQSSFQIGIYIKRERMKKFQDFLNEKKKEQKLLKDEAKEMFSKFSKFSDNSQEKKRISKIIDDTTVEDHRDKGYYSTYSKKFSKKFIQPSAWGPKGTQNIIFIKNPKKIIIVNLHSDGSREAASKKRKETVSKQMYQGWLNSAGLPDV